MSVMQMGTTQMTLQEGKRIISLLNNSFADYLAARVLYTSELLIQATILANTAIEKYFKAYLEVKGLKINIPHDPFKIFQTVKREAPTVAPKISEDYLKVITKVYKSRHLENVDPGYNFVILKRKFLAELDSTFAILEPLVRVHYTNPDSVGNLNYQQAVDAVDPRLYADNFLLNEMTKKEFVETIDLVHEFRIIKSHETLELRYYTQASVDDGKFGYTAFEEKGTGKDFALSHMPIAQHP